MSRSGYSDDCENDWSLIRWRGAVASGIRGKRGQAFLREMAAAMDAMPVKRLLKDEIQDAYGEVCAIGAVAWKRGMDTSNLDPEDRESVAGTFNISPALAAEIVFENDEAVGYWSQETPEQRFCRVRRWVQSNIHHEQS